MATVEVKIPTLGESVSEGVIAAWRKQDGEQVQRDDILLDLETDKAVMEIPAETSGRLSIVVPAGSVVRVGDVVGRIDADAAESSAVAAPAAQAPEAQTTPPAPQPQAGAGVAAAVLSPAVRRLVAEHGLDPAQIPGSGKDGRLTKGDVLAHLERSRGVAPVEPAPAQASAQAAAQVAPPPVRVPATDVTAVPRPPLGNDLPETERVPMSTLRRRIAERLVEAQRTAAILTTFNEIDMSAVKALRADYGAAFEKRHGVRLGFMSIFARACIEALREYREVNAQISGDEIVYFHRVHLGIAVGTPRGLLVPVVRNADAMSIAELEAAIAALAAKARDGKITPDDLSGGTFTISNGGVYGSLLSTPILNPPQTGILGMHKIEDRPVVVDGAVVVRPMMYVALSYDHRLIDGEQAVRFLVRVKEVVENPVRALLDV